MASEVSYYINPAYYDDLVQEQVRNETLGLSTDIELITECQAFLNYEARLLDEQQLERWLDLFIDECLYWLPSSLHTHDPRKEVAIVFDDRRRLLDRVARLNTGRAHSQIKPSRTRRLITNVEVWSKADDQQRKVLSNFVLYELRNNDQRAYAGQYEHLLQREGNTWKIAMKRATLLNCDEPLNNLTFMV